MTETSSGHSNRPEATLTDIRSETAVPAIPTKGVLLVFVAAEPVMPPTLFADLTN